MSPGNAASTRKKWFTALAVAVVCDLAGGLFATEMLFRDRYLRKQDRTQRQRSGLYHHDLRRLVDTESVWRDRRVTFRTNSLGFRDRSARRVPLQTSSHRLVFIGDSFAEAVGVEYDESFVGLIEEELQPCGIEVLNAAVVSYSPSIYYRKTRYLVEEVGLDLDELVVFLDLSDIKDEAESYELDDDDTVVDRGETTQPLGLPTRRPSRDQGPGSVAIRTRLKEASLLLRFVDLVNERLAGVQPLTWGRLGQRPARWTLDSELYERYGRKGLQQSSLALERLLEVLEPRGIAFTLAVYPWPDQIAVTDLPSIQQTYWGDWASRHGVLFVDLFPAFMGGDRSPESVIDEYFLRDDFHFNERGHRLVADHFLHARQDLGARCEGGRGSSAISSAVLGD